MESTFVSCTIAKKANHHTVGASHLLRKGCAGCYWNSASNNSICSKVAGLSISDVHASTASSAVTGLLGK